MLTKAGRLADVNPEKHERSVDLSGKEGRAIFNLGGWVPAEKKMGKGSKGSSNGTCLIGARKKSAGVDEVAKE